MPVLITKHYCPNCRCKACWALRNPEPPEEIGKRVAREAFDKWLAERDSGNTETPNSEQGSEPGQRHGAAAKPRPVSAARSEPVTTETYGQAVAKAIAEHPNLITLTEGQISHIADEERKARRRRLQRAR